MRPQVLKDEKTYKKALALVDGLMSAKPGTVEFEDLQLWVCLVEKYEEAVDPIAPPDPVDAIRFRMDQAGLRQADLVEYMGSKSRVSEILNRKRALTLGMIRSLHQGLGIPLESLVGPPRRGAKQSGDRKGSAHSRR